MPRLLIGFLCAILMNFIQLLVVVFSSSFNCLLVIFILLIYSKAFCFSSFTNSSSMQIQVGLLGFYPVSSLICRPTFINPSISSSVFAILCLSLYLPLHDVSRRLFSAPQLFTFFAMSTISRFLIYFNIS